MLRKLMKHELRATGRIMLPMLALSLIAAVGGNISVYQLMEAENNAFHVIGMLLLTAFVLAIMAVCILPFILMVRRFYKNLLRDEGYLMMTLPVSVHEHIWSKLLVSLIWFAAAAAAMMAAMLILVFRLELAEKAVQAVGQILSQLQLHDLRMSEYVLDAAGYCAELLLLIFLAGNSMCLNLYAAMALGHSFDHHKTLLSIAAFIGFSFAMELAVNALGFVMNALDMEGVRLWMLNLSPRATLHVALLSTAAVMALIGAVYYALTVYFLKNRLNLS